MCEAEEDDEEEYEGFDESYYEVSDFIALLCETYAPVSYTHLDVYKRQG